MRIGLDIGGTKIAALDLPRRVRMLPPHLFAAAVGAALVRAAGGAAVEPAGGVRKTGPDVRESQKEHPWNS